MTTEMTGAAIKRPWRNRSLRDVENAIFGALSSHWGGNDSVPGLEARYEFGESWPDVAVPLNDGFELWIGTMDKWHTNMNRHDAHKLALWILVVWWGRDEWFGLRRWLWYKLLHRRVSRFNYYAPSIEKGR